MSNRPPKLFASACLACGMMLLIIIGGGCQSSPGGRNSSNGSMMAPVSLARPVEPARLDVPLEIAGARNEWIGCAIQITDLPPQNGRVTWSLTLSPRSSRSSKPLTTAPRLLQSGYQVIPVPADLNRPGYIRQTGLSAPASHSPGALLPMTVESGRIDLANLRDPADPARLHRDSANGQPLLLWIDLLIPPGTPAGEYAASIDLHRNGSSRPIASIPLSLTVYDFDLTDQPSLRIVGRLDWHRLETLFPRQFQQVQPRLISRDDPRTAPAVDVLDELVRLARRHRTSIIIPRLQPTVKWGPAGRPPQIDWAEYDSLISPWLETGIDTPNVGTTPMTWSIPEVDHLDRFDARTQAQYWQQALAHFEERQWLDQSILFRDSPLTRFPQTEPSQEIQQATTLLEQHPQLHILLPHHAAAQRSEAGGEIREAGNAVREAGSEMREAEGDSPGSQPSSSQLGSNSTTPEEASTQSPHLNRLLLRAPGPVFSSINDFETTRTNARHWLAPGPNSSTSAATANTEPDLRLWAWLALLRNADTILWDGLLPRAQQPGFQLPPADTVWFYPGHWFGVDQPVPALQLKWLRRAQQDYEYLIHARDIEQDDLLDIHAMARLLVRPVNLPADHRPDPLHTLLSGTSDPAAWDEARRLIAQAILLDRHQRRRPRLSSADLAQRMELSLQAVHWTVPLARPVLIPRTTTWSWPHNLEDTVPGNWINFRLDAEIYTPTLTTGHGNQIEWVSLPSGWSADPKPKHTPPLETYEITPISLHARINLNELGPEARQPLEIRFTDGYSGEQTRTHFAVPVAASGYRPDPVFLDGSLDEWHSDDAIHEGALVRMYNRPAMQRQGLQPASTDSSVYTAWNDDALLVAFRLEDATAGGLWWRNFVDYQLRRAWGEDLSQIVIQPVYLDNTIGRPLHIVCKPRGQWVERQTSLTRQEMGDGSSEMGENRNPHLPSPFPHLPSWQPFEGAGIRYASTLDNRTWRGELAIPWEAILEPGRGRPALLRFNFTHHRHATGESASWAGPIDFGRDDSMMGLLILRQPPIPGLPRQP